MNFFEIIEELTNKFKLSVPSNETELVVAFKKYLNLSVETLKNSDSRYIDNTDDYIKSFLIKVTDDFIKYDLFLKKKELIIDREYEKICKISGEVYDIAKLVLQGKTYTLSFSVPDKIAELEQTLNKVKEYNKDDAQMLVSETILDLNFIDDPSTEIRSLRLGHLERPKH